MKLKYWILILSLITLNSCGSIPSGARLSDLPPLVIPESLKIQDAEWKCLANKEYWKCPAFQKIGKRDNLKSERIKTLRNKIKSTR